MVDNVTCVLFISHPPLSELHHDQVSSSVGLRLRVTFDLQVDVPVDSACELNNRTRWDSNLNRIPRYRQRQPRSRIGVDVILGMGRHLISPWGTKKSTFQ